MGTNKDKDKNFYNQFEDVEEQKGRPKRRQDYSTSKVKDTPNGKEENKNIGGRGGQNINKKKKL